MSVAVMPGCNLPVSSTPTISGNRIEYPVGAGIVADSDPEAEWNETIAKAWPIIRVTLSAGQRRRPEPKEQK